MKTLFALAAAAAFFMTTAPAEARSHRHHRHHVIHSDYPDTRLPSGSFVDDRYPPGGGVDMMGQRMGLDPLLPRRARHSARPLPRHTSRLARAAKPPAKPPSLLARYAAALPTTKDLSGYPAALVSKAHELGQTCGAAVISAFRPGARVRGSGHLSLHALKKAIDVRGNYACISAHLRGWPGGASTDPGAVHHIHISYEPHGREWGARFAHYGHGPRYARRHHRHPHYAAR